MENQGSFPKYLRCKTQMDVKSALQNERDFDMIFQIKLFLILISPKITYIAPLKTLDLTYTDLKTTRFRFTQSQLNWARNQPHSE